MKKKKIERFSFDIHEISIYGAGSHEWRIILTVFKLAKNLHSPECWILS